MPELSPGWKAGAWLAVTVLASALFARLGWWQLDRAAQKQQLQQAIAERGAMDPLPAAALARDESAAAAQYHRRTVLRGRWLERHTVYLDNRQMAGRPGFFVVTPLQLAADDVLLVQRGWLPRDPQDRTRLPQLLLPPGEVEVRGRIAPPPSRLLELGPGSPGRIRQNLDLAAHARETGLPLRPVTLLQTDAPGQPPAVDGLLRDWPVPAADVGKHHGYALQWFAFSLLTAGLYVWFQLIRPWLRRHGR